MKINQVEAKNFKGLSAVSFKPQQFNILCGENGTGKTSILESLRSAITGKFPPDKLRTGSKSGLVGVDIQGIGSLQRTFTDTGSSKTLMCGKTATAKAVAELLQEHYGSRQTMDIMFSSELMEAMMGAELAEYLLNEGFLKNDLTLDKLLGLCTLSRDAQETIEMHLEPAPAIITLNDIQNAYDECFEIRTSKKREQKEAEAKAKYDGPIPTSTSAEINRQLEKIMLSIGAENATLKNYNTLKNAYDQHISSLRKSEEKLKEFAAVKAPVPSAADILAQKIKANDDMLREVSASKQVHTADCDSLKRVLGALAQPICPISKKLVCATDKTTIQAELEEQISQKEKLLKEQIDKVEKLSKEKSFLASAKSALEKQTADYREKCLYLERYEAEKKISVKEPKMPNAATLASLQNDAAALRASLEVVNRYEQSQKAAKDNVSLNDIVSVYEELVNQLSPKGGVRQKVLAHSVAPLQAYCNSKMPVVCPKYDLFFDVSNGFNVMLIDKANGEAIGYNSASNGEKIRIAYVLMSMFNALTNFRILVLDNLDGLDDASCESLLTLIQNDIGDYDHIFLASASDHICKAAKKCGIKYCDVPKSV